MGSSRKIATNENISTYGAAGQGRDYTALSTWEAATDIDLVSASQSEVLECYDDATSFDDYTQLIGAINNSSYFRIIRPAPGEGHDGTSNNGFTLISTTDAYLIRIDETYSQLQDLIGKLNINSASTRHTFGAHKNQNVIVGCIVFDSINSGAGTAIGYVSGTFIVGGETVYVINCLANNVENVGFTQDESAGASVHLYNCSAIGCGSYGFHNISVSIPAVFKNCCSSCGQIADWGNSGGGLTKTTCTAEGATPTYRNVGENDFHLANSDIICKRNGTDLSSDGDYAFDDDIDGVIRSNWDIGFDEYSWRGKINGVTNPSKICGISVADISNVMGI